MHELDTTSVPPRSRLAGARDADGPRASDELFALVYEELRRLADRFLACERRGQTLQPTALVHEAYLRLSADSDGTWESRAHFFGAAARAIRCILIDRARARRRLRRGGDLARTPLEDALAIGDASRGDQEEPRADLLDLDESLRRLASVDPDQARVVELRFFGGLSVEETAEALGSSPSTVARHWRFARAWLHRDLCGGDQR